jgi:hypothetical protein
LFSFEPAPGIGGQPRFQLLADEGKAAVRSVANRRDKGRLVARSKQTFISGMPRCLIRR